MFGGTTIYNVEIWTHPIEITTIKKLVVWSSRCIYIYIFAYGFVLIPNFQHLDSAEPPETSKKPNPITFYWVVVSHIFSCFTPTWGWDDPIWLAHIFSNGSVQPPTCLRFLRLQHTCKPKPLTESEVRGCWHVFYTCFEALMEFGASTGHLFK